MAKRRSAWIFFFLKYNLLAVDHRDGKKTKASQTKAANHSLNAYVGTSPAVQWLGLCAPDAAGTDRFDPWSET